MCLLPVSLRLLTRAKFERTLKEWRIKNHFYSIKEFGQADISDLDL